MKKFLIAALAVVALAGCSDADYTEKLLESQGYTDVQTTGHSFFACGKDDTFATGFEAKGPTGKTVRGTVCSGMFVKNATIRFEL